MRSIFSVLVAISATLIDPNTVRVDVETLGADHFKLIMVGLDGDERISQAAITPLAARLCPGKAPVFGPFRLIRQVTTGTRKKKVASPRFEQEISCSARPPVEAAIAAPSIKPDAALEGTARATALAFLDAYDSGQGEKSWQMFGTGMQSQEPLAKWSSDARAHAEALGRGAMRRIVKFSWYTDPPGVAPGLYGAADFVGSSSKQMLLCGYVALFRERDRWSVVRIETGSLPRSPKPDPAQFARLKQELRCADG